MVRGRMRGVALAGGAALILTACAAAAISTQGSVEAPRIAFVTAGDGPNWREAVRGARAAAENFGVDLRVAMPSSPTLARQTASLLDVVADQPHAVAICPADAQAQRDAIDELARDSYVVTFDTDAPAAKRHCFVGMGDYAAGRRCGELVREAAPGGGRIAVLLADFGDERLTARLDGFRKAVLGPLGAAGTGPASAWSIVEPLDDSGDEREVTRNLRQALAAEPELTCVVDLSGRPATGLVRAVEEAGRAGQVKIVVLDDSEATLRAIESGAVYGAVRQDSYAIGFETVKLLASYLRGPALEIPARGIGSDHVPGVTVQRHNVAAFLKCCAKRPSCQRLPSN